MNILLFGEYSGFFNALKFGLKKNNCKVTLAGRNDGFKNYPLDINLEKKHKRFSLFNILRQGIYKLTKFDILGLEIFFNFLKNRKQFKGFDIVLLINPYSLQTTPFLERFIIDFLFKNNQKIFLSACGDDAHYVNFLINANLKYSILTPYLENKKRAPFYKDILKYTKKSHKKLQRYTEERVNGIIAGNIDYMMAYKEHPKYLNTINFPVVTSNLKYTPTTTINKVTIFHGINTSNYFKKGNYIFERVLEKIKLKYPNKVDIITTKNLPYNEYINKFINAHIILDQSLGYGQGYNALEAMYKGKVVFSGAEKEWINYIGEKHKDVLFNASPNEEELFNNLEQLILNPKIIIETSKKAHEFVAKFHNPNETAKKYINEFVRSK